jgi:hypothetical protein
MTTTLHAASAEWYSRPDDQRFTSFDALLEFVTGVQTKSTAQVLDLRQLVTDRDDRRNQLFLSGYANGRGGTLTNWAFGQLCAQTGAPAQYLRRKPVAIADTVLGYELALGDHRDDSVQLLYREDTGSLDVVRAATGPKYGRIWDAQLVQQVMRMNERSGGAWTVPLDAYKGEMSKKATTLYASDRDVFVFLVNMHEPYDIDGQTYFRGFFASNSEVGDAKLKLSTFLFNYVCANRIVWGAREVEEIALRHTSLAPERFEAEVVPALAAIADSDPTPILNAVKAAKETYVGKTISDVQAFLARKGFGKLESATAIRLAAEGPVNGSSGNPSNLLDLVQGGTAYARGIPHQDDRLEVERKFSSLLDLAGKITPKTEAEAELN